MERFGCKPALRRLRMRASADASASIDQERSLVDLLHDVVREKDVVAKRVEQGTRTSQRPSSPLSFAQLIAPCQRTPSEPAFDTGCINRPARRLHPTEFQLFREMTRTAYAARYKSVGSNRPVVDIAICSP